jgi:hypothetical protein
MMLVPEANQGPMLGIFITGPGGALLGLILYAICRAIGLSDTRKWQLLLGTSAALGLVTLYFCLPQPALRGHLIDAQVQGCKQPSEQVDGAIEYWQKRVAAVTWAPPRQGWEAEARQLSKEDDGVVLDVLVLRENGIYEQRKPWNKGKFVAQGWHGVNETKSFYVRAPGSCSDFVPGAESVRFAEYDLSGLSSGPHDWPPRKVSDFLNLQVLDPVPTRYRVFADN